jgi:hypothetical protein
MQYDDDDDDDDDSLLLLLSSSELYILLSNFTNNRSILKRNIMNFHLTILTQPDGATIYLCPHVDYFTTVILSVLHRPFTTICTSDDELLKWSTIPNENWDFLFYKNDIIFNGSGV